MRKLVVPALSAAALVNISGCDKAKKAAETAENGIFAEPAYTAVEGDADVGKYLQPVPGAAPFDAATMLKAMDVGGADASKASLALAGFDLDDQGGDVQTVDGDTLDLLTANQDTKNAMDSSVFKQTAIPASQQAPVGTNLVDVPDAPNQNFDHTKDTFDASLLPQDFMISTVNKVSVKNQGNRGTCASHAGVGAIEYLIMKKHGSELASVDLSEQRFYMLSKSDLWSKGGGTTDQDGGSAWIDGYYMSAGMPNPVYGTTAQEPPTDSAHAPFNIPLEADCPYNDQPGANEIQIPQAATCERGAVKVTNATATYSSSSDGKTWVLHTSSPQSANDILKFMATYDLPVPVGTTLTANWMDNDGMITFAKSQQPGWGPHAGGHAYLIVGARKLDESKYPNEGGMCFVIKNSWGTGWGQQGFSCMTLAWFNANRGNDPFDVALDVDVDLAYLQQHQTGTPPPADLPAPAAPGPVPAPAPAPATEPAASIVVTPVPAPAPQPAVPDITDNNTGTDTGNATAAATTSDGFTVGRLALKDGRLMQVLFKNTTSSFVMRGVLAGQTAATQDLTLGSDGTTIYLDDQTRGKTHVAAGTVSGDLVTLCSGKYALTCDLNLVQAENRFAIGISEAEFRNYAPDEKADYKTLVDFANYGIQYSVDGIYTDLKLIVGGQPTNPIRLAIKPVSGSIMFRGQEIGNYQKLMLCSGDYDSLCRMLVNGSDQSLKVFFKSKTHKQ